MYIKCAWCGKDLGEKEPLEDKSITHGMCDDCYIMEVVKVERNHGPKKERTLINFQNLNCPGCRFADKEKVGTGEPCCTFWQQIEVKNNACLTRRPSTARPGEETPKK